MRLVLYLLSFIFLSYGQKEEEKKTHTLNPEVINAYISTYVNNRKYDIRLYDPPPPPQWKDSLQHNGRRKPDSIINKLKPLKIYINFMVKHDSVFKLTEAAKKSMEYTKSTRPVIQNFVLDKMTFPQKPGIELEFISKSNFFKKQKKIQYNEGYGGYVSFKNLYYAKNEKKACFEVYYFKGRLNSSNHIVYAEFLNGKWVFKSEVLSIS